MANREVNLTKRVQTARGWRYCRVVLAANGRVKPDLVLVGGKQEAHPEGAYYLEWREGGKRVRLSVGSNAQDAAARRLRKEAELNAVSHGVTVVPENGQNGHRSLATAVTEYLADVKLTHKPRSYAAYQTALNSFLESCHKLNLEEVDRRDLLKFSAFLREEKEQAPRTVYNKFEHVMTFLKAQGIRGLAGKKDWPRYTEEEPEIYEKEELDKLFAACDAEEQLWFEFFLMTGMREQEVMHTYWSDVNFAACTVRVTHNPDRGWTPKAYKEREVPIPAKLVKSLKAWKAKADKNCGLVFPTSGCNPKLNFLDDLKAVAERADFPTKASAWRAAELLRKRLEQSERSDQPVLTVRRLVEQYRAEKMPRRAMTRQGYNTWLNQYIIPKWGECALQQLQARPIDLWLTAVQISQVEVAILLSKLGYQESGICSAM